MNYTLKGGPLDGQTRTIRARYLEVPTDPYPMDAEQMWMLALADEPPPYRKHRYEVKSDGTAHYLGWSDRFGNAGSCEP